MKKIFSSVVFIALMVASCTKTTTESESSAGAFELGGQELGFTYDSLSVGDSLAVSDSVSAKFKQKVLVFTSVDKPILDSLYKGELYDSIAPGGTYSKAEVQSLLEQRKADYYTTTKKDLADFQPGIAQVWDRVSEMDVISHDKDYLTVHYHGYGYTGGAHGYAYDQYKVVDLENQKQLKLEDIVEVSKVNWNKILLAQADERKSNFFEPQKLSYTRNFFFDDKGITFSYGQYEIAAYVYGIITIQVPYSLIFEALKPEFKDRMGLQQN